MNAARRTTVIASACLLVSLTASVLLLRHIDEIRPPDIVDDTVYINSPKMIRLASRPNGRSGRRKPERSA